MRDTNVPQRVACKLQVVVFRKLDQRPRLAERRERLVVVALAPLRLPAYEQREDQPARIALLPQQPHGVLDEVQRLVEVL